MSTKIKACKCKDLDLGSAIYHPSHDDGSKYPRFYGADDRFNIHPGCGGYLPFGPSNDWHVLDNVQLEKRAAEIAFDLDMTEGEYRGFILNREGQNPEYELPFDEAAGWLAYDIRHHQLDDGLPAEVLYTEIARLLEMVYRVRKMASGISPCRESTPGICAVHAYPYECRIADIGQLTANPLKDRQW